MPLGGYRGVNMAAAIHNDVLSVILSRCILNCLRFERGAKYGV